MSREIERLESVSKRFNSISWHDSKLIDFGIKLIKEPLTDEVSFHILLLENAAPGHQTWKEVRLVIKDCRILHADVDLLGKRLIDGDIASASCGYDSPSMKRIAEDKLKDFDLPQDEDPFAGLLHFRILLIHPGGEINVIGREFEVQPYSR